MNNLCKPSKLIAVLLALALLLAALPAALAEGGFKAVVAVDSMKVYAEKAPHDYIGALPRGTAVTVKAVSGSAALISLNGKTGVARAEELSPADEAGDAADTTAQTSKPMVANRQTRIYKKASTASGYSAVQAGDAVTLLGVNGKCAKVSLNGKVGYMVYSHLSEPGAVAVETPDATPASTMNMPVVTARAARVSAKADGSGGSATLQKGEKLTLLAVKGERAMVEKGGAIGFMDLADLEKDGSGSASAVRTGNPFASGSNEHAIYAFLTGELGYNRAAAMGVMANIKYESSYQPGDVGDGGTSYGICQWHAGRKTNLMDYCAENGLDYTALDAQLKFLKYELTGRYASVHSYMKGVENTADGAYDAGYYFCFNFEAPAARTSQSTKRGEYAKNTLFEM